MGNNNGKNKFGRTLAIMGGITILGLGGVSIFGGVSVFESLIKEFKVVLSEERKENSDPKQLQPPPTPIATESSPIETTVTEPTATPIIIIATPETDLDDDADFVKHNAEKLEPEIESDTKNETKENETNKTSDSITEEPKDNKENSDTLNSSDDVDNTDNVSNIRCRLSVNSSGKLVLETDEDISESDATVNISCVSDSENVKTYLSYNYSDLVNQENHYDNEPIRYITIAPGVYIVNFINCDIENVNFYLDTEAEEEDEEENSEPIHVSADSYKAIPSQDIVDIEVSPNDGKKYISVFANRAFSPLIKLYSKSGKEIDANLRIVNDEGSELKNFNISQIEDDTMTDFLFEEGKEYCLEINVGQNNEVNQETLCLQITDKEK